MSGDIPTPLKGNSARQAPDLFKGIEFQLWRSVEAWVNLKNNEALYLEGAEDFDIVDEATASTVQTRATAANISLRSDVVTESLLNFWELRAKHPEKILTFQYVTTSSAAEEEKPSLGLGIKGLEYWNNCSATKDVAMAEQIRLFLTEDKIIRPKLELPPLQPGESRPQTLLEFLDSATANEVIEKLVARLNWALRSEDSDVVRQSVVMLVNAHGRKFGMRALDCSPAVDRLYRIVSSTAGKQDERLLTRQDFLSEFDDATHRTLSASDRMTSNASGDIIREALGGGLKNRELLLEAAALIQVGPPELGSPVINRSDLVAALVKDLTREQVLVLHGSSGMGKTKTARLVAREIGGEWIWADFQGVRAQNLPAVVRLLAANLGDETTRNVALDNMNFGSAELQAVDTELAAIVRLTRLRGGRTIITTQRELGVRTMQKAGLRKEHVAVVPRLTEKEIQEFCKLLGCPDALAHNQAKVVWLLTSGHPQLVHARLAVLGQASWPKPNAADLTAEPKEIGEEKDVARQLLDHAPQGDKELLFRLSLTCGAFRKDHAVAVAQIAPSLLFGADAFNRLLGPWIEAVGAQYYRLSPLLSRAAIENWSATTIQTMRVALARAFLNCGKRTLREADEILFQGFATGTADIIGAVAAGLTMAPMDAREAIDDVLFWLPMIGRKSGERAVKNNAFVNLLIRIAQFKIAGKQNYKDANELCALADQEYIEDKRGKHRAKDRWMWLTNVLFDFESNVAPTTLVGYWREILELSPNDPVLRRMIGNKRRNPKKVPFLEGTDLIGKLMVMVLARKMSPAELVQFATAINSLSAHYRQQALIHLQRFTYPLRLAIDRAWSIAVPEKTTDWSQVVADFWAFHKETSNWGIPSLDVFVRRAVAAVEDEYLNNAGRAMEVLSVDSASEASWLLQDQRALVLFRKSDYKNAARIWREILPNWQVQKDSHDLIPVYACHRAAHASGRVKDWPQVLEFCKRGGQLASILGEQHFVVTFLADEGFAQWKIGNRSQALSLLQTATEGFEKLPSDPDQPILLHGARKMFEQVIKWCRSEIGIREDEVYEPPAGVCSRIDFKEDLLQYPTAPFDLIWYYLTNIEAQLHSDRTIYNKSAARISSSKYAVFRSVMLGEVVKEKIRLLDLGRLVNIAIEAANAVAEAKAQRATGNSVIVMDRYQRFAYPDPSPIIEEIVIGGLIALASAGRALDEFLPDWESDARALTRFPGVVVRITDIRKTLGVSPMDAVQLYLRQNQSQSTRFTAAVRMAVDQAFDLDQMFVGHAALYSYVDRIAFKTEISAAFGELVRRRWLERIRLPAIFQMPRLTIPAIKAACDDPATGLRLAARILLAAKDAVPSQPPTVVVRIWQEEASLAEG